MNNTNYTNGSQETPIIMPEAAQKTEKKSTGKKVFSFTAAIAIIVCVRLLIPYITAPECTTCGDKIMGDKYRANDKLYCYSCKPAGIYR